MFYLFEEAKTIRVDKVPKNSLLSSVSGIYGADRSTEMVGMLSLTFKRFLLFQRRIPNFINVFNRETQLDLVNTLMNDFFVDPFPCINIVESFLSNFSDVCFS